LRDSEEKARQRPWWAEERGQAARGWAAGTARPAAAGRGAGQRQPGIWHRETQPVTSWQPGGRRPGRREVVLPGRREQKTGTGPRGRGRESGWEAGRRGSGR